MKYRKLIDGDYAFGNPAADFFQNQPEAVAQAVQTRLGLFTGEWFLDTTEGTAWRTQVLGRNTDKTYDLVIKQRILGTQGVTAIAAYSSTLDRNTRKLSVLATISTIYGSATVQATI